jgi:hypothetical protein
MYWQLLAVTAAAAGLVGPPIARMQTNLRRLLLLLLLIF